MVNSLTWRCAPRLLSTAPAGPDSHDQETPEIPEPEEDYPWPPFSSSDPLDTNWGFGRRENLFNDVIARGVERRWEDPGRPLPGLLFKALIAAESGFDPSARSPAGALGLVQLMPSTASAHGLKLSPRDERLLPEKAVPVGVAVLSEKHQFLLNPPRHQPWGARVQEAYETLGLPSAEQLRILSLAGYNGGASTVVRAMATAFDRGLDPRAWENLVGDRSTPTGTPLYQAVREVFGEGDALRKYREMAAYPDRVMSFFHRAAQPLDGTRIMIDAGHGGTDPGAVGPAGVQEKDVTLGVSLKLRDKLEALGADVRMTRDTDRNVAPPGSGKTEELRARVDLANAWPAELFISVHANSATNQAARGTEVFVSRQPSRESQALAREIHTDMVDRLGLQGRGVKRANFYVIRHTTMPSVLVETAFISNPVEEQLLADEAFQDRIADSIAAGATRYEQAMAVQRGDDPLQQDYLISG